MRRWSLVLSLLVVACSLTAQAISMSVPTETEDDGFDPENKLVVLCGELRATPSGPVVTLLPQGREILIRPETEEFEADLNAKLAREAFTGCVHADRFPVPRPSTENETPAPSSTSRGPDLEVVAFYVKPFPRLSELPLPFNPGPVQVCGKVIPLDNDRVGIRYFTGSERDIVILKDENGNLRTGRLTSLRSATMPFCAIGPQLPSEDGTFEADRLYSPWERTGFSVGSRYDNPYKNATKKAISSESALRP